LSGGSQIRQEKVVGSCGQNRPATRTWIPNPRIDAMAGWRRGWVFGGVRDSLVQSEDEAACGDLIAGEVLAKLHARLLQRRWCLPSNAEAPGSNNHSASLAGPRVAEDGHSSAGGVHRLSAILLRR
jgi:hypothetical protein